MDFGAYAPVQRAAAIPVSSPHDPAEKEAEDTAHRVMRLDKPEETAGTPIRAHFSAVARAPAPPPPPAAARPPAVRAPAVLEPDITQQIKSSLGGGKPLPANVIAFMAPRFKADFSNVRIHIGPDDAKLAARLQARAFTFGKHVFFAKDQFKPDTAEGRELIAHELTHTIQQREVIQRQVDTSVALRQPVQVQRFSVGDVLQGFADKANMLPGFRLLTIVLGVNPLSMQPVPRDAANLIRAAVEFIPGGGLLTQALDHYGIIEKAGAWLQTQLAALGMAAGTVKAAFDQFLGGLRLSDAFHLDDVWARAKSILTAPIAKVTAMLSGAADTLVGFIRDAILKPLGERAAQVKGWALLCAVLGRDPITGETVPRNADTLIGGFMTLIGQDDIWANIKQSGASARCWSWFDKASAEVKGIVDGIPALFVAALHSLGLQDLLTPIAAFTRVAGIFGGFAERFVTWAGQTVWNLLEIVFDVVKPGAIDYVKRTGAALKSILKNPIPFVGNLVRAAKLGFTNFASRIGQHLKTGLLDWLTGALPGVYIPQALTLAEIGKFALSVLGISWAQIRGKIVKALGPNGEKTMQGLETTFDVVVALVKGGPAAAWEIIKDKLGSLRDTVIDGIIGFVTESIVEKAIPKLISMFIPGAGFISAIVSIYDTVMVFVQKLSKIAAAVKAFIDSIVAIAAGQVEGAADKVETTLAGLLSLAINFLAGFLGLGNVSAKVMEVVGKVRGVVDKALDKAVEWVVGGAKKLGLGVLGMGKAAVGWMADLLRIRKPVVLDSGERHTLFFEAKGDTPVLMVASKTKPVRATVAEVRKDDAKIANAFTSELNKIEAMVAKQKGKNSLSTAEIEAGLDAIMPYLKFTFVSNQNSSADKAPDGAAATAGQDPVPVGTYTEVLRKAQKFNDGKDTKFKLSSHHIVPDFVLGWGNRAQRASSDYRIAGAPSLADGPAIGLQSDEHRDLHTGGGELNQNITSAPQRGVKRIKEIMEMSLVALKLIVRQPVKVMHDAADSLVRGKIGNGMAGKWGRATINPNDEGTWELLKHDKRQNEAAKFIKDIKKFTGKGEREGDVDT